MKITSKAQFFSMWESGILGNRTRLWRDPEEALTDATRLGIKEIGFREIGKTGGGAWEKGPSYKVCSIARRWRKEGRIFIMDDGAPDYCRMLQGEVCRTHRGMEGFLDTVGKLPMRPAMAAGHMRHCSPLTTMTLLDHYMDPSSRDDLDALFDLYPDAAIEFSTFGCNVGIFPGRNTLYWETRDY